jgi:hypothetical protein
MGGPAFCETRNADVVCIPETDNFFVMDVNIELPDGSTLPFRSCEGAFQAMKYLSPETGMSALTVILLLAYIC